MRIKVQAVILALVCIMLTLYAPPAEAGCNERCVMGQVAGEWCDRCTITGTETGKSCGGAQESSCLCNETQCAGSNPINIVVVGAPDGIAHPATTAILALRDQWTGETTVYPARISTTGKLTTLSAPVTFADLEVGEYVVEFRVSYASGGSLMIPPKLVRKSATMASISSDVSHAAASFASMLPACDSAAPHRDGK